jgi:sterol desaturase/sphingolipid hydroxylase (fatty acid hydroxylase superfamily)
METSALTFLLNFVFALILMAAERLWPNINYAKDTAWNFRAIILGSAGIALTLILGNMIELNLSALDSQTHLLFRENWLNTHLSSCLLGLLGYYCVTFFVYWWHRLRHANNTCWRLFHQIHHSTHRLQTVTAFYAHPFDFLSNALLVNFVAYILLGFNLDAALWTTFWVGIFELWEHTNIKTPRWIGYVVVRPEMHRVHHEKNQHASNYAIPLWDMIFRTYENSNRQVDCGFEAQNERKMKSMLLFKAVE